MRRIIGGFIAAGALGALSACGGQGGDSAAESEAALEFMEEVLEPAAYVVWESAGWVIDAEGEHDLSPTTDEGWAEVRQGALDVMAAGETLKTASFRRDDDSWDSFSQGIIDAGALARDAAEAQDGDRVFEVGSQLYRVCLGCHQFYRVGEFAEE